MTVYFSSDIADISATHIWAWSWCSFWTNDTWEVYRVFAQEENWNQGFITWSSIKLFFYHSPYIVFHSFLTCLSFEYIVLLLCLRFPFSYIFTLVGVIIMGAYVSYSEFVDFYNNYLLSQTNCVLWLNGTVTLFYTVSAWHRTFFF